MESWWRWRCREPAQYSTVPGGDPRVDDNGDDGELLHFCGSWYIARGKLPVARMPSVGEARMQICFCKQISYLTAGSGGGEVIKCRAGYLETLSTLGSARTLSTQEQSPTTPQ